MEFFDSDFWFELFEHERKHRFSTPGKKCSLLLWYWETSMMHDVSDKLRHAVNCSILQREECPAVPWLWLWSMDVWKLKRLSSRLMLCFRQSLPAPSWQRILSRSSPARPCRPRRTSSFRPKTSFRRIKSSMEEIESRRRKWRRLRRWRLLRRRRLISAR